MIHRVIHPLRVCFHFRSAVRKPHAFHADDVRRLHSLPEHGRVTDRSRQTTWAPLLFETRNEHTVNDSKYNPIAVSYCRLGFLLFLMYKEDSDCNAC